MGKKRDTLIEGIDDAEAEKYFAQRHAALLQAVVRQCFEDATTKLQKTFPGTKISLIDRSKLLKALGQVRRKLEDDAAKPEAYARYTALSASMIDPASVTEVSPT
jgi:hypothetical protein